MHPFCNIFFFCSKLGLKDFGAGNNKVIRWVYHRYHYIFSIISYLPSLVQDVGIFRGLAPKRKWRQGRIPCALDLCGGQWGAITIGNSGD